MKKVLLILMVFPFFIACKDREKENRDNERIQFEERENPTDTTSPTENGDVVEESATEKDGVQTEEVIEEEKEPEVTNSSQRPGLEGGYTRVDPPEPEADCQCYCVEISFSTPTELCISSGDVYISARFASTGNNQANVFFVEDLRSENLENEIPWGDFDKTTPIATVNLQPDGSMKLDWLGFAIDGEIAVDYAIYGKKTLEGIYKRK